MRIGRWGEMAVVVGLEEWKVDGGLVDRATMILKNLKNLKNLKSV